MTGLLRVPGRIASVLMIVLVTLVTWWGANELYHEGWWGAWYHPLAYLLPTAITLVPTLLAFRWPVTGGTLIAGLGTFTFFFFGGDVAVFGLLIVLVGLAFVLVGIDARRSARRGAAPAAGAPSWRARWRYLAAIGAPLLVLLGVSGYSLPVVLTRVDDGDRSARLILGNDVALTWAPAGPGWNWRQPWGGYPSWQSIALYGVSPIGLADKPGYGPQRAEGGSFASAAEMRATNLCRFLSDDGTALLPEPQDSWRVPTTAEVVRSLGRHGQNAGCTWNGELGFAECDVRPDKESPLWATDVPVIYYWTADSYDQRRGYYVAFNGAVNATYKPGGNPRHGYRCVR